MIHLLASCHRDKISFLNITDPKKRDAIVKEYLDTIKRIKNRNLLEKSRDLVNRKMFEETLRPVVRSTAESTEAITKELVPIKEGITALNANFKHTPAKSDTDESEDEGEDEAESEDEDGDKVEDEDETMEEKVEDEGEPEIYQKLMREKARNLDKYFGILNDKNGRLKMGNKYVKLMGNDIVVDGTRYTGTQGLWNLISLTVPTGYTPDDMTEYKKLVEQTNVMRYPQNQRRNSEPKKTWKWRVIFKRTEKKGQGIEFLPSDIISLKQDLAYLLGEY